MMVKKPRRDPRVASRGVAECAWLVVLDRQFRDAQEAMAGGFCSQDYLFHRQDRLCMLADMMVDVCSTCVLLCVWSVKFIERWLRFPSMILIGQDVFFSTARAR